MRRQLRILRLTWYTFKELSSVHAAGFWCGICYVVDKMTVYELISLFEGNKISREIHIIDRLYDYNYIWKPSWYNIPRRVILMNKILREVL